ncbi:MAG: DUF2062 domain-containing protein [Bryobacterales bacterium]
MSRGKPSRLTRFGRWSRLQLIRMVRENSTPARTGLGFALGAFIGIFPSFLIGTPVAFLIAGRLGWNRAAAAAGTFLTNPLTAPLLYSLSAWLGLEMLGREVDTAQVHGVIDHLREFGLAFLLGNTVVALSFATLFGVSLFFVVRHYGRAGMRKMLLRMRTVYSPPTPAPPAP